jgi:Ser/Thr protein kinase RdoA (MazF antagonist)
MNEEKEIQKRIHYAGELKTLLEHVCELFDKGKYQSHRVITIGYEDFNVLLETTETKYFVKFFADFRDRADCMRYVNIIERVIEGGVKHPAIHKSKYGYLSELNIEGKIIYFCLMDFIDGKSFFDLNEKPTPDEVREIINEAIKINRINYKPDFNYDSWAIINFLIELNKIEDLLDPNDKLLIAPLKNEFQKMDLNTLPYCLVHGDLIKTNVIRSKENGIYFIDCSVTNYYPRIIEPAVLLCDVLFDSKDINNYLSNYNLTVELYKNVLGFCEAEIAALPFFVKLAHAMHIIGATREREIHNNHTPENQYWLDLGREGLRTVNSL